MPWKFWDIHFMIQVYKFSFSKFSSNSSFAKPEEEENTLKFKEMMKSMLFKSLSFSRSKPCYLGILAIKNS